MSVSGLVRRYSCLRDAWSNEWRDLRFDWWKIWRWHRYAVGILSEYRHQWRLECYAPPTALRCPDTPRQAGDTVGCGSLNVTSPDEEGLCDCLDCGMWFDPSRESDTSNRDEQAAP